MKTIGSHPGAISFRFLVMVILFLIFLVSFFRYVDSNTRQLEHSSIQQTRRVIDSSLVVAFSSLAVKGELNRLNELVGANPFGIMQDFNLVFPDYQGEIEKGVLANKEQRGWFYSVEDKVVLYQSDYEENNQRFAVTLVYEDVNQTGKFEVLSDKFKHLYLKRLPSL